MRGPVARDGWERMNSDRPGVKEVNAVARRFARHSEDVH